MKWRVALRLGRVSNLPTVWTNVLTGVVLAGGADAPAHIALALLALSLFYVAGMFLNDAFDREFDARERPERPIPSGAASAHAVLGSGFAMLGAGVVLLGITGLLPGAGGGWRAAAAGIALAGAIVLYDRHHKENPLSPLLMGVCRMLVYLCAGFAVATEIPGRLLIAAALLVCYLIGLTYAAKQEHVGRIEGTWPLAFLVVPFVYLLPEVLRAPLALVLYLALLGWVAWAVSLLVRGGAGDVPRAVVSLIAGIALLDAVIIATAGEPALALAAAGAFAVTLALQRRVPGT